MIWKKLIEETPIAIESGDWDGLKSEALIVADKDGKRRIAVMYEGTMDGSEFIYFQDEDSGYYIDNVVHWAYIPPIL